MTEPMITCCRWVAWLKCCQPLGYFPWLGAIPVQSIGYVRDELDLYDDIHIARVQARAMHHHKGLVQARLGLIGDPGQAAKSLKNSSLRANIPRVTGMSVSISLRAALRPTCVAPLRGTVRCI